MTQLRETLLKSIESIYGPSAPLSDCIQPDGYSLLERIAAAIATAKPSVDYLEIGSFMGVSMLVFCTLIKQYGKLGRALSIDPYYERGYEETPPWIGNPITKVSTPETMASAMALYQQCGLTVEIQRRESSPALLDLIRSNASFDLIYIDGNHEGLNPMFDFALSYQLLRPQSFIVLDDTTWPDIKPVKDVCDRQLDIFAATDLKTCYWNRYKTRKDISPN